MVSHYGIIHKAHLLRAARRLAVLRHVAHELASLDDRHAGDVPAADLDLARLDRRQPRNQLYQLELAVAFHPGYPHNLAPPHRKRHPVQPTSTACVRVAQIVGLEHHTTAVRNRFVY